MPSRADRVPDPAPYGGVIGTSSAEKQVPRGAALAQGLPEWVPAPVALTQFGESFNMHIPLEALSFVSSAAQEPPWPPLTRESATPPIAAPVFHPLVATSDPRSPAMLV